MHHPARIAETRQGFAPRAWNKQAERRAPLGQGRLNQKDPATTQEEVGLPRKDKVLRIGDRAPDFSLRDAATGQTVSLGDLVKQPLFLIFGRGTW